MKKILIVFFVALIITSCKESRISGKELDNYWAQSYIVMEQNSKYVLKEKNASYCQSVASISKIMTAILAIESNKLDHIIKIGEEIKTIYGSQVYLKINAEISLKELVYGLLLRSGNDCAVVIATYIAGTKGKFVDLMNKKAIELGMTATTFKNPHGLDEEDGGNISNCRDMAILQAYCLENEVYRSISGTKSYKSSSYGVWNNKNRLLNEYEYTTSGKTGYTVKAKRTLITSAKKDNTEFIIVTLNCGNDFRFHMKLYNEIFNDYETKKIFKSGVNEIDNYSFYVEQDLLYFQSKDEWSSTRLLYHIDKENKFIEVYLIKEKDNQYFLKKYEIIDKTEHKNLIEKSKSI